MNEDTHKPPDDDKSPRHRSPNYPGINLMTAVAKITAWFKADGIVSSPREAAIKHFGFEKLTSDAARVLSALRSFGLIMETDGRIKLTQRGIDIVARGAEDAKRQQALKDAALSPAIYQSLIKEYPGGRVSDMTLSSELTASKGFNPKSVDAFVKDFRATLKFASISDNDAVESKNESDKQSHNNVAPIKPKLGDYVQWTSAGVDQFSVPQKVAGVSEDGEWAFFAGTGTGVPMSELTITETTPSEINEKVEERSKAPSKTPPLNPNFAPTVTFKQDIFSLGEGDVSIKWPASISAESFEDLAAWLDILKRKIGRSIKQ